MPEASLYRTDSPADGPITPAETVAEDFLRLLVDALKSRGADYRVAATFAGGDAELPVGWPPTTDLRFTDRISILVRADSARRGIRVRRTAVGTYEAALSARVAGAAVRVPRGWITATLTVRGTKVVVVNTHLESSDAAARAAQGQQLLAGVAKVKVPLVLLGDFNSGPRDGYGRIRCVPRRGAPRRVDRHARRRARLHLLLCARPPLDGEPALLARRSRPLQKRRPRDACRPRR